jgi:hypothetical protein
MQGARALALPVMPDRTIAFLSIAAAAIFTLYIVLVIVTITFATVQTSLASRVRDTEGAIAQLETTYYASISKQNASSPASVGLVAPAVVQYAVAKPAQGISFAGK